MNLDTIQNHLNQACNQASIWAQENIATPVANTWNNRHVIVGRAYNDARAFCAHHQVAEKVKSVGLTILKSLPWVALAIFTPWYVSLGVSAIAITASIAARVILWHRHRQQAPQNLNQFLQENAQVATLVPVVQEATDGISTGMLVNGALNTVIGLVTRNFLSVLYGVTSLGSAAGSLVRSPRLQAAVQGAPYAPYAFLEQPAV